MSRNGLSFGQAVDRIRTHKESIQHQTKTATGKELEHLLILKASLNIALEVLDKERAARLTELRERNEGRP
jgi:hypothetical protein